MLDVPVNLRENILFQLNRPENLAAWQALLATDAAREHRLREREAYDTTFSVFHRELRAFVNELLDHVRYRTYDLPGATLLGVSATAPASINEERWLPCVDVFALWSGEDHDPKWVRQRTGKRPLSAFRVGTSVFYLSGMGEPRWRWRRWRGTEHDPLMRLPYQRKYDRERHRRADELLRWHAERVRIAGDLLYVVAERVEDVDVSDGVFQGLELGDVQEELGRMGCLGLGGDDLLMPVGIELCQMRMEYTEGRPSQPRIDFTIAEGRYDGVLGGYHRRPSGALRLSPSAAGKKWILTRALVRLQENLDFLVAAPREHRAILRDRWRTLAATERGN